MASPGAPQESGQLAAWGLRSTAAQAVLNSRGLFPRGAPEGDQEDLIPPNAWRGFPRSDAWEGRPRVVLDLAGWAGCNPARCVATNSPPRWIHGLQGP